MPDECEIDMACYDAYRRNIGQDFMILVAGPQGVGKTSLIRQALLEPNGQLRGPLIEWTIEESFETQINGTRVNVVDTGGDIGCRTFVAEKMARAQLVVLVFDAGDMKTLYQLEDFADMLVSSRKNPPPVVLAANKCDQAIDWRCKMSEFDHSVLDNVSINHFDAKVVDTHCDVTREGYHIRSSLSQRSTTKFRDTLASAMTLVSSRSYGSSLGDIGSVGSLANSQVIFPHTESRSCGTSPRQSQKGILVTRSGGGGSEPSTPRPKMSPRACSTGQINESRASPPGSAPSSSRSGYTTSNARSPRLASAASAAVDQTSDDGEGSRARAEKCSVQ